MRKILHELNYLKAADFWQAFLMLVSLLPTLFYKIYLKIRKKKVWLVCEDKNEACDNGFCFFTYLCREHPEIDCRYAISYKSPSLEKVRSVGRTVKYGSIMHWILYFSCEYNISSQKAGKPGAAVCYALEVFGIIKSRFIFLQHGITLNRGEWLFYENTKMRLFICGAKPEYEYIKKEFGYPDGHVAYLGFTRFDDYHTAPPAKRNRVLLMPSWREWIASKNEYSNKYEDTSDFTKTEYYQKYQELISSPRLAEILQKYDLELYFYPHRNMQKYIGLFHTDCDRVHIADSKSYSIRELLISSAVMITDYSSVALDFAYMQKPVLYYQFDEARFREAQYAEGYFSYRGAGLGSVTVTLDETLDSLDAVYARGLSPTPEFLAAHKEFFEIYDKNNCERTYTLLKNGLKGV